MDIHAHRKVSASKTVTLRQFSEPIPTLNPLFHRNSLQDKQSLVLFFIFGYIGQMSFGAGNIFKNRLQGRGFLSCKALSSKVERAAV